MARILVDADSCPVVTIVERIAKESSIECILFCDTNHVLNSEYGQVRTIGAGADAVDFAIAARDKFITASLSSSRFTMIFIFSSPSNFDFFFLKENK